MAAADPVLAELRRRWAGGDRVAVERLVASHPALAHDPDRVLDLIYAEVLLREERGEKPAAGEYAARFPTLAAAIRTQFEVHDAIRPAEELPEVPGYTILREVGRGGAGAVYEAEEETTGRRVAVKVIRPELLDGRGARRRFAVEARAGMVLAHPNIVPVYTVGESADGLFLVMELLAGSLEELIRTGPLDPADAAELLAPVAEAIHFAHEQGVVHRDLKPANILLAGGGVAGWRGGEKTGGDPGLPTTSPPHHLATPKVSDFGLAKLVARSLAVGISSTQTGAVLGTPAYMPPEQAAGLADPGPAQDVYSLGAVLFAALTGRPPFDEGSPLATLIRVRAGRPPSPREVWPEVPVELDAVCRRCLSADPAGRYGTAAELADELRGWLRTAATATCVLTPAEGGLPLVVRVTAGGVVLGRSKGCDGVIPTEGVSRRHCRLTARGGVFVEDLGSRHGTTVNGVPVRGPTALRAGDELGIARRVFRAAFPD